MVLLQGCATFDELATKASSIFDRAWDGFERLYKGNKERERAIPPDPHQGKSKLRPPAKVYDIRDRDENITTKSDQGVYVRWGREGSVANQNSYPVKIKKVWVHGQDRTIAWQKIFDPGADYLEYNEPNAVFEIYSITGLEIGIVKAPK